MGIWGGEDSQQGGRRRTGQERWQLAEWAVPPLHVDKLGGTTEKQDKSHNLGFQPGEIKSQKYD